MTLIDFAILSGVVCLATVALYFIALLTPKLAAWIDKLRVKSPDPYDGVLGPARVEDNDTADPCSEEESGNDDNQENKDNGDI